VWRRFCAVCPHKIKVFLKGEGALEHTVITIAREYASGGRLIGKGVADRLGFAFYDKELIALTAKQTGFAEEVIAKTEQTKTKSLLYNLAMGVQELPMTDQIFIAQTRLIQQIASKEPCVIVGRGADYALRDLGHCLRVFVHAPAAQRIRRAEEEYGVKQDNMEAFVRRQDKSRALYYSHFTQQKWGMARQYHLCIDSSIGIDRAVDLLVNLVGGEA